MELFQVHVNYIMLYIEQLNIHLKPFLSNNVTYYNLKIYKFKDLQYRKNNTAIE